MKLPLALLLLTTTLSAQTARPAGLTDVKRVYVAALSGRSGSDTLRELIIASLDATKLFVLTDDPDRADAILKGAGEEHTFEDNFDAVDSVNTHTAGGKGSGYGKSNGLNLNLGAAEAESHHSKERKHEAFAAVRLCSKDGDVLWSTTQESLGAKFRGAGADVAAKIAKQLTFDMERARKPVQ